MKNLKFIFLTVVLITFNLASAFSSTIEMPKPILNDEVRTIVNPNNEIRNEIINLIGNLKT